MMINKHHNIIYKITNSINNKIYIGRHSTNNINDGYMGSGKILKEELKLFDRKNFKKEILFDFDNPEEMIAKEIELLTANFVNRDDNYNLGSGQGGLFTHDSETRIKLRNANIGLVSVKDKDGNNFKVKTSDPRYISGELKHNTYGTVCVKDNDGKKFRVLIDDPRYLSGELVGSNTGNKRPTDTIEKHKIFINEYWKNNKHSDDSIEKMSSANKNKVTVRDKDGNVFRVSVDDERLKTGELVNNWLGKKHSDNFKLKNSANKKNCIWISNVELRKNKLIKPTEWQNYINSGWIAYRLFFAKSGWELKLKQYLQIKNEE